MKKLLLILSIVLTSCSDASITETVLVEQINITNKSNYNYEVKLKSKDVDVYYYTNVRYQVGDTLDAYRTFFGENGIYLNKVKRENDSLKKELITTKYYLEILKERVFPDTIKRK